MNYALTEQALRKLVCSVKDKHYTYIQNTASDTWIIEHNLGKNPSVEVIDSGGSVVVGDVQHNSVNTLTIKFTAPFSGKAFLN